MKKIDTYVVYRTGYENVWCYEAPTVNPMDSTKFDYITSSVFRGTMEEILVKARAYKYMMGQEYGVTFDLEIRWPDAYNGIYSMDDPLAEVAIVLKESIHG